MAGLVFKWLKEKGGLKEVEKFNIKKASVLYDFIDQSYFYYNDIDIFVHYSNVHTNVEEDRW